MVSHPRMIIRNDYKRVYDKVADPDLYWGLHGVTINWTAEIETEMPKQLPDGSYSIGYRVYAVSATLEDNFDFNPGQFKNFPAKQLNDIGASKGVPFHITIELSGFGWQTDNVVVVRRKNARATLLTPIPSTADARELRRHPWVPTSPG